MKVENCRLIITYQMLPTLLISTLNTSIERLCLHYYDYSLYCFVFLIAAAVSMAIVQLFHLEFEMLLIIMHLPQKIRNKYEDTGCQIISFCFNKMQFRHCNNSSKINVFIWLILFNGIAILSYLIKVRNIPIESFLQKFTLKLELALVECYINSIELMLVIGIFSFKLENTDLQNKHQHQLSRNYFMSAL